METQVVSIHEPVSTKIIVEDALLANQSSMEADKIKLSTFVDEEIKNRGLRNDATTSCGSNSIPREAEVVNGSANKETERFECEKVKNTDSEIIEEKAKDEQGSIFVHEPESSNINTVNAEISDMSSKKERVDDITQKQEELTLEKQVIHEDQAETKHSPEQEEIPVKLDKDNIEKSLDSIHGEVPLKNDELKEEKDSTTVETSVNGTEEEHNVTVSAEEILRSTVNETAPEEETATDAETTKGVFLEVEKEEEEEEEEIKTEAEPRLHAKENDETKTVVEDPEIVKNEETTSHETESLKGDDHQRGNAEPVEAIKNSEDAEQSITQKTKEVQESLTVIKTPTIQGEDTESKTLKDTEEHEHVLERDMPQIETLVAEPEAVNTSAVQEPAILKALETTIDETEAVHREKGEKEEGQETKEGTEMVKTVISSDEVRPSDQVDIQAEEIGEHTEPCTLEIKNESQGREEYVEVKSKETVQDESNEDKNENQLDVPSGESEKYQDVEPETALVAKNKFEEIPSDLALKEDDKKKVDQADGTQTMEGQRGLDSNDPEAEQIDRNRTNETEEKLVALPPDVESVEQMQKPSNESPSEVLEKTSKTIDERIEEKTGVTLHQEGQEEGSYGLDTKQGTLSVPESSVFGEKSQEEESCLPNEQEKSHEPKNDEDTNAQQTIVGKKSQEVAQTSSASHSEECEGATIVEAENIGDEKVNEEEQATDKIQKSLETVETDEPRSLLPSSLEKQEHGTVAEVEKIEDEKVKDVEPVGDMSERSVEFSETKSSDLVSEIEELKPEQLGESLEEERKEVEETRAERLPSSETETVKTVVEEKDTLVHDEETTTPESKSLKDITRNTEEVQESSREIGEDTESKASLEVEEEIDQSSKDTEEHEHMLVRDMPQEETIVTQVGDVETSTVQESAILKTLETKGDTEASPDLKEDEKQEVKTIISSDEVRSSDVQEEELGEHTGSCRLKIKDETQEREESVVVKSAETIQDESNEEKDENLLDVPFVESEKYQDNEPETVQVVKKESLVSVEGDETKYDQTRLDVETDEKMQKPTLESPSHVSVETCTTVDEKIIKPEEVTLQKEDQKETTEETVSVPKSSELEENGVVDPPPPQEESCLQNEQEKEEKLHEEQIDKHEPINEVLLKQQSRVEEHDGEPVVQAKKIEDMKSYEEEQVAEKIQKSLEIVETDEPQSSMLSSSEEKQEHGTVSEKIEEKKVEEEPIIQISEDDATKNHESQEEFSKTGETTVVQEEQKRDIGSSLTEKDSMDQNPEEEHVKDEQKQEIKSFDEEIQIPSIALPLDEQEKVSSTEKGETKPNESEDDKQDEHVDSSTSPMLSEENDNETLTAETKKEYDETSKNVCIKQEELGKLEAPKLEDSNEDKSQEFPETMEAIEATSDQTLPIGTSHADNTPSRELVSGHDDQTSKQVKEIHEEERKEAHKVEATGDQNLLVETSQISSSGLASGLNNQTPKQVEEIREEETKEDHNLQAKEILPTEILPRESSDEALVSMLASREEGNCAADVRETKDKEEERPVSVETEESVGETKTKEPKDEILDQHVETPTSPIISKAEEVQESPMVIGENTESKDLLEVKEDIDQSSKDTEQHEHMLVRDMPYDKTIVTGAETVDTSVQESAILKTLETKEDIETSLDLKEDKEQEVRYFDVQAEEFGEHTGPSSLEIKDESQGREESVVVKSNETVQDKSNEAEEILPTEIIPRESSDEALVSMLASREGNCAADVRETTDKEEERSVSAETEESVGETKLKEPEDEIRDQHVETPTSPIILEKIDNEILIADAKKGDEDINETDTRVALDSSGTSKTSENVCIKQEKFGNLEAQKPEESKEDKSQEIPETTEAIEVTGDQSLPVETSQADPPSLSELDDLIPNQVEEIHEAETTEAHKLEATGDHSLGVETAQADQTPKQVEEIHEEKTETHKLQVVSDHISLLETSQEDQSQLLVSEKDDQTSEKVEEIHEEETKEAHKLQEEEALPTETVPRESFSEAPVSILASNEDEPVTIQEGSCVGEVKDTNDTQEERPVSEETKPKESEAEGTEKSDDQVDTSTKVTTLEDEETKKTDTKVDEITKDQSMSNAPENACLKQEELKEIQTLQHAAITEDPSPLGNDNPDYPTGEEEHDDETSSTLPVVEILKGLHTTLETERAINDSASSGVNKEIEPTEQVVNTGDAEVESNEKDIAFDIIEASKLQQDESGETEKIQEENGLAGKSLPKEELNMQEEHKEEVKEQEGIRREFEFNVEEKLQEETREIAERKEENPADGSLTKVLPGEKILIESTHFPSEEPEHVIFAEKQDECEPREDDNVSIEEKISLQEEHPRDFETCNKEEKAETHEAVKEEDQNNEVIAPEKKITELQSEDEKESNEELVEPQAISDDMKSNDAATDFPTKETPMDQKEEVNAKKSLPKESLLDDLQENTGPKAMAETIDIAECKEENPADGSLTKVLPGEKILIASSHFPSGHVISAENQEESQPKQDESASISEKISLQEEHPRDFETSTKEKEETHETVKEEVQINEVITPEKKTTELPSEAEKESNEEHAEPQAISDDTKSNEETPTDQKEEVDADKFLTKEALDEKSQFPSSAVIDDFQEDSNPEPIADISVKKPIEVIQSHQSLNTQLEEKVEETSFELKEAKEDKNEETVNALITNENVQVQDQPKDFEAPAKDQNTTEQEQKVNNSAYVKEDIGTDVKQEVRDDGHDSVVEQKEVAGIIEEKREVEYVKTELADAMKEGTEEPENIQSTEVIPEADTNKVPEQSQDPIASSEENKTIENEVSREEKKNVSEEIDQEESKQTDTITTVKEDTQEQEKETNQERFNNVDDVTEKTQAETREIESLFPGEKSEQKDEVQNQQKREIAQENLKIADELQQKDEESEKKRDLFPQVEEPEPAVKEPARKSLSDLIHKVKETNKIDDATTTKPHIEEEAKTEEEDEDGDEHKDEKTSPDSIVMVEAKDTVQIIKTKDKKSQGILSGVGSKVKHSISKVKKVLTGKSSHTTKPSSPK